jgi:hypothetical protein
LRIAQVEGQPAAGNALGTGGLVQLVEGQLDRLAGRLAEAAGGAGQRNHHARSVRAGGGLGTGAQGASAATVARALTESRKRMFN